MWVWSTRQNTRTIRFSSVKDGGRLYSKTLLLPLQCRTLVLMRVMRKVSVTLKSVSNASVTRKILPQGPSAWTKKRSFKKKGLKIPFPRLSQCAFKRIQFCDLYSFSPAFLAAMKFVSNRSEIDKCNQVTGLQMIYKFLFQELHIIRPCQRVSRRKNVSLKLLSCPLHSHWVVKLVTVNKN